MIFHSLLSLISENSHYRRFFRVDEDQRNFPQNNSRLRGPTSSSFETSRCPHFETRSVYIWDWHRMRRCNKGGKKKKKEKQCITPRPKKKKKDDNFWNKDQIKKKNLNLLGRGLKDNATIRTAGLKRDNFKS